jgi:hypothetical protein
MPTLAEKQAGMMLRQRVRRGRRRVPWLKAERPAMETQLRAQMYLTWVAGHQDLDQLARRFDRPRAWLKAWFDAGCPLMTE